MSESHPMRAVIIDAEIAACERLKEQLATMPAIEVVAVARTLDDAAQALARADYELVFLDPELESGAGLALAAQIHADAALVFVTAHERYAARAFEVNALDFLVKPVSAARLAASLRKLRHRRPRGEAPRRFSLEEKIFLKGAVAGGRFAFVHDIVAIFSSENYSEVLLLDGERCLVRRTMQAWERALPGDAFFRIHRTAIVNLGLIDRIERTPDEQGSVTLRGLRQPLPVSRRLWSALWTRTGGTRGRECK